MIHLTHVSTLHWRAGRQRRIPVESVFGNSAGTSHDPSMRSSRAARRCVSARVSASVIGDRASETSLTWIEVGAIVGPEADIPAAALRSTRLQIIGSGIGSVPGRDFVSEIPKLVEAIAEGAFDVRARAVPLSEVEQAWTETAASSGRLVLVPQRCGRQ